MNRQFLAVGTALATTMSLAYGQAPPSPPTPPPQLEEVVVTATRRSENVQKIPYNITALSGATLSRNGIGDITSLRNSVPGLTIADYGVRGASVNSNIIIRGINTEDIGVGQSEFPDLGGATVSNYIDETPVFTNLKLTDIARVEILRGPQGTLFGADSVGGTVRTIHNKPDPSKFDYTLDGSFSGTDHASQPNSTLDATFNVPITDRIAVRVNAGYDREAGFINADNAVVYNHNGAFLPYNAQPLLANPADPIGSGPTTTDLHGINSSRVWYARGDALAHITDDLTAELSYQHQNDTSNGFSFEAPGADYVTHRRIPLNPSVTNTDIEALTLTEDFGFATVTSSSSYYNVDTRDLYDNSGLDSLYPNYYGGYPRLTTTNYDFNKDRAFTQEVRMVSPKGDLIDYVVGAYYQNRRTEAYSLETIPGFAKWSNLPGTGPAGYDSFADYLVQYYGGTRPGTLNPADLNYDFKRDVQFTDLAAFGEATYHVTPAWRLTFGARVFQENFRQTTIQHIYDLGTTFASDSLGTSIGTGAKRSLDQIFKTNTAYDLGPNTLAYFTFSQGYRAGGANAYPIGTCGYCNSATYESFGPDSANNFELGIKGTQGRFRYTADIYDIEWSNIQLEVTSNAGTPIIVNGKSARSRGLELEGHFALSDTITLSGGYAYTEAKITQDFTDGGFSGIAGTPLPGVSHHQVNGNIDYSPPLWPDHEVDLHLDGSYRSGLNNQFEVTLPSFRHISGYALFNAFAQAQITPKVSLQVFAHNLFNAKGISAASSLDPPVSFDTSEFVTRPLTVGLRLVIRR